MLDALFARLPLAPRAKCTQGLSDRAYFCDAEGWVCAMLAAACAAGARSAADAAAGAALPCAGEAVPQMRYLIYAEAGGGLPPHTDLSRNDLDGRASRCTFILYLTDCSAGGETVLLEQLAQPSAVLAAVTPRNFVAKITPAPRPSPTPRSTPVVAGESACSREYTRSALERNEPMHSAMTACVTTTRTM